MQVPEERNFIKFMQMNGPSNEASRNNYLAWLRYVREQINPDFSLLTRDEATRIANRLSETSRSRTEYQSESAIANIKTALNKYAEFRSQNRVLNDLSEDVFSLIGGPLNTTAKAEIDVRLGQGKFRYEVVNLWKKCAVTQFEGVGLLVASHIKPWRLSLSGERVDPHNGLLLTPNLDKLFDRGYISFNSDGSIILSQAIDAAGFLNLGVSPNMKLYKVVPKSLPYLEFHRSNVLAKI